MRKQITTTSYSMLRTLHQRMHQRLPMHGDKSKLVARLIEMWLDGKIPNVSMLGLRSRSVVQSNITSNENCSLT